MYEIRLTRDAQAFYQTADKALARQLNRCFDQLRQNPYAHPNIKHLKGPLAGQWRYRVGDWRVIYCVEDEQVVIVLLIVHRSKVLSLMWRRALCCRGCAQLTPEFHATGSLTSPFVVVVPAAQYSNEFHAAVPARACKRIR